MGLAILGWPFKCRNEEGVDADLVLEQGLSASSFHFKMSWLWAIHYVPSGARVRETSTPTLLPWFSLGSLFHFFREEHAECFLHEWLFHTQTFSFLSPSQLCLQERCHSATVPSTHILVCGFKCPLPCSPVYVLPEISLNPLLTEGSSPILFISVIYSSKVILIESQVGEEEPVPTLSFGTHLFHFNPFGRSGLLVLALGISGLKCPGQSLDIASASLQK